METIFISDLVLTKTGLGRLLCKGWRDHFDTAEENTIMTKRMWINPETLDIYEKYHPKTKIAILYVTFDILLRAQEMQFHWEYSEKISHDSELGELLSAYILSEFENIGYYTIGDDIKITHLQDYGYAYEYLKSRFDFYGMDNLDDIPVYLIPKDLWDINFQYMETAYSPGYDIIILPDVKFKSENWKHSLLVHEFTHAIQKRKGWLTSAKDLGLDDLTIRDISAALSLGCSINYVANVLDIPLDKIKKLQSLSYEKNNYYSKYFYIPTEAHAFAEEFKFLVHMGIPTDKIEEQILKIFIPRQETSETRRNKELLKRMINHGDEIISRVIAYQEDGNNDSSLSCFEKFETIPS
jgi:hypothetical protein